MFNLQVTSTTMELLPLVCLCLLTRAGTTFAEEGSKVIRVEEDSDVTLPCSLSTKEDIELKLFDWNKDGQKDVFLYDAGFHSNNGRDGQDEQFKGRVSHFPDELKLGDASIKIINTSVTDSGDYTCAFPRLQPRQIFHIRLVVDPILKDRSGENIPGAAAKPSVTILDATNDWVLLQCEVQGASPKPKVEWQDRAGNILPAEEPQVSERGGRYNIILQTNVTKTDVYRCVATQEDINHQIYAETFVYISEPKVIYVKEGSDVTLPCSLSTKEDITVKLFDWKKDGQKEVLLYDEGLHYKNGREGQDQQFKGRVSHFPDELKHGDASIKINKTKLNDSGDYTCAFPRLQPSQIFHIRLVVVGVAAKPSVTILDATKDWSLLQCEVQGASPKPNIEWQDSAGNILPAGEPQVSERRGRYDITLQTTVTKTDRYRCVATQKDIYHQANATIYVYIHDPILKDRSGENIPGRILKDRSGENPGAAPKPYVKKFEANNRALLQCEVRDASPKPKVEWQDSAGNILPAEEPQVSERGGRYDIILQTTVTKTDRYRCVATQEDINHQIYFETYVYIPGSSTGLVVAVSVLCTLLVGGVVGVLLYVLYKKGYIKFNSQRGSPQETSVPLKVVSQT